MAKGSPVVQVRVPCLWLATIKRIIAEQNQHRKGEPYTVSSWVSKAIFDRLAHIERSRKKRVKGKLFGMATERTP